jgi:serine/threonine protein phosphatase PrpC
MWTFATSASVGGRDYQQDVSGVLNEAGKPFTAVVCDGMGGEANGFQCADVSCRHILNNPLTITPAFIDALRIEDFGPTYIYDTVPSMPWRGGTTALAFFANDGMGAMMSCGDSQGFIFTFNEDGSLKKVGMAHNASTGLYGNILLEAWGYRSNALSLDTVVALNAKGLVVLASDGIDVLIPEVRKQQRKLVQDNLIPFTDGIEIDDSFMELLGRDFSNLQAVADRIVNAAVAAGGAGADNTTVIVALFNPHE